MNIRSEVNGGAHWQPRLRRIASVALGALLAVCAAPGQAALSFKYTVTTHYEALENNVKAPPDSTVENAAALGERYLSVVSPVRGEMLDFAARLRYRTDETNKTYVAYSLFDMLAYRVMEQQNRIALSQQLAAMQGAVTAPDPLFDENILSLPGASARALEQRPDADGAGADFFVDGKLLARASGGVDVSPADAALFTRFLRYQAGGHPLILARLEQMHRVPAKLVLYFHEGGRAEAVTITFAGLRNAAAPALAMQGYTRRQASGDGLDALLDRAAAAPVRPIAEIQQALSAETAAAFAKLRALDALLATLEMNLSTGSEPQPFLPAQKAAIELEPAVNELLHALSVKDKADMAAAMATLRQLQPKATRRAYMLKLFEANDRAILGENQAAIDLLISVLQASPGLAGAYKDLGDKLFGSFDMVNAWRCWDAGRRIAPALKLFAQVNRFEAELQQRHPEYF